MSESEVPQWCYHAAEEWIHTNQAWIRPTVELATLIARHAQQQPQPASEDDTRLPTDRENDASKTTKERRELTPPQSGVVSTPQPASEQAWPRCEEIGLYEATTPERPYACDETHGAYFDEPTPGDKAALPQPTQRVPLTTCSDETFRKMAWITGVGLEEVIKKEQEEIQSEPTQREERVVKRYIVGPYGCTICKDGSGDWIEAADHDRVVSEKDATIAELSNAAKKLIGYWEHNYPGNVQYEKVGDFVHLFEASLEDDRDIIAQQRITPQPQPASEPTHREVERWDIRGVITLGDEPPYVVEKCRSGRFVTAADFDRIVSELRAKIARQSYENAMAQASCKKWSDASTQKDAEIAELRAELHKQLDYAQAQSQRAERAEAEFAKLEAILKSSCEDEAEDDTAIRDALRPYLSADAIDGDSWGVPSLPTVVQCFVAEFQSLQARFAAMETTAEHWADKYEAEVIISKELEAKLSERGGGT